MECFCIKEICYTAATAASAFFHQADIKFHSTANGFQANTLIVAVDGTAFLGGHIHSGETVYLIADSAIVPGV